MTDFLSRVAARAVGASAAARPRLGGLFEPAGAASDATLEVVEEEIVTRARAPQREETLGASERVRQAAPLAEPPPIEVAHPPEVPAAPRPAPLPDFVARSNSVPAPPSAIAARAPAPEPLTADGAEQSESARLVVAAPLAQALPVSATRQAPPPAPTAPQRPDEPTVRVHIGRLEVRANVQPPPPERPRREPARSDGLSLGDYLRGKREVRS